MGTVGTVDMVGMMGTVGTVSIVGMVGSVGTVGVVASGHCDMLVMDVGLFIHLLGFCLF